MFCWFFFLFGIATSFQMLYKLLLWTGCYGVVAMGYSDCFMVETLGADHHGQTSWGSQTKSKSKLG